MGAFAAFRAKGEWLKGNCHTHTSLSDGKSSPEEVARAYSEAGYDFLVFTDHRRCHTDAAAYSTARMLVITGAELHPPLDHPHPTAGNKHHIVALGISHAPTEAWVEKRTARAVIRWIERHNGVALFAHPYWSGHDLDVMLQGRNAFGVEIFNTVCETTRGRGLASGHVDQALAAGARWRIFAVDDTHAIPRDPFGGWIMVKSPRRTEAAILKAIRQGHFYATQGPEIRSMQVRTRLASLECSPAREVIWHSTASRGRRFAAEGAPLTRCELPLDPACGAAMRYLRAEVVDANGKRAWSNPVFWDAIEKRWTD